MAAIVAAAQRSGAMSNSSSSRRRRCLPALRRGRARMALPASGLELRSGGGLPYPTRLAACLDKPPALWWEHRLSAAELPPCPSPTDALCLPQVTGKSRRPWRGCHPGHRPQRAAAGDAAALARLRCAATGQQQACSLAALLSSVSARVGVVPSPPPNNAAIEAAVILVTSPPSLCSPCEHL